MNWFISAFIKLGLLKEDLDYHVIRASMVVLILFFGYQKWFEYEAQVLIPYISNGPLISFMYPVFGIRGASWLTQDVARVSASTPATELVLNAAGLKVTR